MNKCPENIAFDFVFYGQCPIDTCQHCTRATPNGCMFLDRKDSEKSITNKEIKHYKKELFPEFADYDQKALDSAVRQAQSRARSAICMQMYINSLAEDRTLERRAYVPKYSVVHNVHNYLKQTFDRYEDWMIYFMDRIEDFTEVSSKLSSLDITLGQTLGRMTPKKFEAFCHALEMLRTQKEETDGSDYESTISA